MTTITLVDATKQIYLRSFTTLFDDGPIGLTHSTLAAEKNSFRVTLVFPVIASVTKATAHFRKLAALWINKAEDGQNLQLLVQKATVELEKQGETPACSLIKEITASTCWHALVLSLPEQIKNSFDSLVKKNRKLTELANQPLETELSLTIIASIVSSDQFEVQYLDNGEGFNGLGFECLQDGHEHDARTCLENRSQQLSARAAELGNIYFGSEKIWEDDGYALGGHGEGLQRAIDEFNQCNTLPGASVTLANIPGGGARIIFRSRELVNNRQTNNDTHAVEEMMYKEKRRSTPKTSLLLDISRQLGSLATPGTTATLNLDSLGSSTTAPVTPGLIRVFSIGNRDVDERKHSDERNSRKQQEVTGFQHRPNALS